MKDKNLSVLLGIGLLAIAWYGYKKSKDAQQKKSSSEIGESTSSNASGTTGDMNGVGSFSTNSGYQKFPSGMIVQFGYSGKDVKFPIPFPNSCLSVSVTTNRGSSGSSGYNHATNVSLTGFTQILDGKNGYWMAVGY
jgi:hypothetical protein